jgi:hypothetical protein
LSPLAGNVELPLDLGRYRCRPFRSQSPSAALRPSGRRSIGQSRSVSGNGAPVSCSFGVATPTARQATDTCRDGMRSFGPDTDSRPASHRDRCFVEVEVGFGGQFPDSQCSTRHAAPSWHRQDSPYRADPRDRAPLFLALEVSASACQVFRTALSHDGADSGPKCQCDRCSSPLRTDDGWRSLSCAVRSERSMTSPCSGPISADEALPLLWRSHLENRADHVASG